MERGTFRDEKFVRQINEACVPLVMPTSWKDFPSVDVKVDGKIEKRYKDYPRLTVEEAKGLMASSESAVPYGKEFESWVTPVYVIANSEKQMVLKTLDRRFVNPARIFQDLQTVQAKLGKPVPAAAVRDYLRFLAAARASIENERWGDAVRAISEIDKSKGLSDAMKTEVERLRAQVNEKGEERLRGAVENAPGDPAAAREVLQELAKEFKGWPLEKKILDELARLK
jgi:hypothetical protein